MKSHLLLAAAMFAASVATPIESLAQERPMQTMTMRAHPLPIEGTLPSLAGATTWLNSQPLTPEALRGKVVVVDFWTYTCINWQRTEPYVRAWAEKYKDQGLVVIGVHTPEFGFEKNVDNIRPALKMFRIEYPVAVDSDYGIWNAFGNHYWPAVYIVDATGKISMPLIGSVSARGCTTTQLARAISDKLRNGYVREPHVAIEVESYRPFFILGEVIAPGLYPYVPNMTVETAVAIAGGFTPRAYRYDAEVSRSQSGVTARQKVPLIAPVRPGDTITVGERWF